MKKIFAFILILFIVAVSTIGETITSENYLILENIEALAITEGPDDVNPIQYYLEVKDGTCYVLEDGLRLPGSYYYCVKKSFLPMVCHTGCRLSAPSV